MTTKQRAYLKGIAMTIDTIFQIGKAGISQETVQQISAALEARELIKIKVLPTCPLTARETAEQLAAETNAECVQVIGNKLVLYRKSQKKTVIEL